MFSTSRTEFSFGLLCIAMDCSFLKINALRRCGLIWKRKQHTFGTFGQVNKNSHVLSQGFETLFQVKLKSFKSKQRGEK